MKSRKNKVIQYTGPSPAEIGSMQYWDGNNWISLPIGDLGNVFTVDENSLPSWQPLVFPSSSSSSHISSSSSSDISSSSSHISSSSSSVCDQYNIYRVIISGSFNAGSDGCEVFSLNKGSVQHIGSGAGSCSGQGFVRTQSWDIYNPQAGPINLEYRYCDDDCSGTPSDPSMDIWYNGRPLYNDATGTLRWSNTSELTPKYRCSEDKMMGSEFSQTGAGTNDTPWAATGSATYHSNPNGSCTFKIPGNAVVWHGYEVCVGDLGDALSDCPCYTPTFIQAWEEDGDESTMPKDSGTPTDVCWEYDTEENALIPASGTGDIPGDDQWDVDLTEDGALMPIETNK